MVVGCRTGSERREHRELGTGHDGPATAPALRLRRSLALLLLPPLATTPRVCLSSPAHLLLALSFRIPSSLPTVDAVLPPPARPSPAHAREGDPCFRTRPSSPSLCSLSCIFSPIFSSLATASFSIFHFLRGFTSSFEFRSLNALPTTRLFIFLFLLSQDFVYVFIFIPPPPARVTWLSYSFCRKNFLRQRALLGVFQVSSRYRASPREQRLLLVISRYSRLLFSAFFLLSFVSLCCKFRYFLCSITDSIILFPL